MESREIEIILVDGWLRIELVQYVKRSVPLLWSEVCEHSLDKICLSLWHVLDWQHEKETQRNDYSHILSEGVY